MTGGQVYFTDAELRAVYGLLRSTLMAATVRLDPDSLPLRTAAKKLQKQAARAFCGECGAKAVYAKGKCEPCYRAERRKAG